jgi:hypothetical protein
MPLFELILVLVLIGVLLWFVNAYVPMEARIKSILNAVVIIAVVIWLLYILMGVFGSGPIIPMHHR